MFVDAETKEEVARVNMEKLSNVEMVKVFIDHGFVIPLESEGTKTCKEVRMEALLKDVEDQEKEREIRKKALEKDAEEKAKLEQTKQEL